MSHALKIKLLLAFSVLLCVGVFALNPIAQDPNYHNFIDARAWLGIPHFANVLSNLGFLLVGLWGSWRALQSGFPGCKPDLQKVAWVLCVGVFATGIGSSYYHLDPNNATLVWDRIPMTLAFMAFFTLVIAERIDTDVALKIFAPLLIIGIFSVVYWHYTEAKGMGDLRLYVLVQFLPIVLIPVMLLIFPTPTHQSDKFYWLAIGFYILAKLAEFLDLSIFELGNLVSGHSLKHLLAAVASGALVYKLLRKV